MGHREKAQPGCWGSGGRCGPGLLADCEDKGKERGLCGRHHGDRRRQAKPGRHDTEARAAEKRAHVGRSKHHPAGPLAIGSFELIDGEGIDRHVLETHEHVVDEDHPAEQGDVGLRDECDRGGGGDHQGLGDDQPRPATAEPRQPAGIDDRSPSPLEAPGQHRHRDHTADGGGGGSAGSEVGRKGDRDEAIGDPLPHIQEAEESEAEPRMVGKRDHGEMVPRWGDGDL